MKEYDLIVIGSGSGLDIANAYSKYGKNVAVVEKDKLGGTCLNRGCIPSKKLIYRAEIAETIEESEEFHIDADIDSIDFQEVVKEVNEEVHGESDQIEEGLEQAEKIDLYQGKAEFVANKKIEVNGEKLSSEKIVIAAGSRPYIPPIEGLEDTNYWTSREALNPDSQPESLVVIGGGYISTELAYFYSEMGTEVKIIESGETLVGNEDREVSEFFTKQFKDKAELHLEKKATKVKEEDGRFVVTAKGEETEEKVEGEKLFVAAGRKPNSDLLSLDSTDIETDDRGFIKVNNELETDVNGVYALGDIINTPMFKHTANMEAQVVFRNSFTEDSQEADYRATPHAIFSSPEVAGVGKTEQELEENAREYKKATYEYDKTGKGSAMKAEGFVKVLASEDNRILGCHIAGPRASEMIHEVLVPMRTGKGEVGEVASTIHIHPALNEVVQRAFSKL